MFGATGDGASHKFKAEDIAAGKWVGKYEVGDERDYAGLQEAIYAAFNSVSVKPNASSATHNHPLFIPPGNYIVNKPPTITQVYGGNIYGTGRFVSVITANYPGPHFKPTAAGTLSSPGSLLQGVHRDLIAYLSTSQTVFRRPRQ